MINRLKQSRSIATIALILCIILSITVLSPHFSNPTTHKRSIDTISECKLQASSISLTVTLASTVITMLNDDIGTPIAEELADLSAPLLLIVCILFFEQYLLTAMEALSFSILFPTACLFFILSLYFHRKNLQVIGFKLLLIALVCAIVVPASTHLTIMVRDTFSESIDSVNAQINEIGARFSEMLNTDDLWKSITSFASGVGEILEFFKKALGLLIDAVAILLITSCVIPVITVILFIWAIKSIIAGRFENLEDTATSVLKKFPHKKNRLPSQEDPDDTLHLSA